MQSFNKGPRDGQGQEGVSLSPIFRVSAANPITAKLALTLCSSSDNGSSALFLRRREREEHVLPSADWGTLSKLSTTQSQFWGASGRAIAAESLCESG